MNSQSQPIPRYLGILVLLAMSGFAAVGFLSIRRDVENLRIISQDNTQWSASQMEIELLRFRMSLAALRVNPTPQAQAEMLERFDILWSRVFMMGQGHVGENLRRYDAGHGSVAAIGAYLEQIDPAVTAFDLGDRRALADIEQTLAAFQQELREYTLRVLRTDATAAERVRERIKGSARTTALISLAAVLISFLSLVLILREGRRQRQIIEISRRSAEQAELAMRTKSRFLTMMSHELRNPLNGVLGPLALLRQGGLAERHLRLVEQARNSGNSMLQMLSGLLDYGEIQDGRIRFKQEPFRLGALAESLREALAAEGAGGARVSLREGAPDRVVGDTDRLKQIFVHLTVYVLDGRDATGTAVSFAYETDSLVGEIDFAGDGADLDWKLGLLMGLSEMGPQEVTTEALRPMIARGLIAASGGVITLFDRDGRRAIRVGIPAAAVRAERVRVHLETRSEALGAIYRAALRSDRVAFLDPDSREPVDVVLVDTAGAGEQPLMSTLRGRFPGALFVSLGHPQSPEAFDDIVETPNDMSRLRNSILERFAS